MSVSAFSISSALLFPPLPFPKPAQLLWIGRRGDATQDALPRSATEAIAARVGRVATTGVFWERGATLSAVDRAAERVLVGHISASIFSILEVLPQIGRTFGGPDDRPGAPPVAVISDALWRARFGARSDALESMIYLDGRAYVVIGVMPKSFMFPSRQTAVWLPLESTVGLLVASSDVPVLGMVARLGERASIGSLRAMLADVRIPLRQGGNMVQAPVAVEGLRDHLSRGKRPAVRLLWVAGAMLLGVVCLSGAVLQLARFDSRRHDLAVQLAMGAGERRVVAEVVMEAMLATLPAILLGVGGGAAVLASVGNRLGPLIPQLSSLALDRAATIASLAAVGASVLAVGTLQALSLHQLDPAVVLKEAAQTVASDRIGRRTRAVLACVGLGLTLALLSAALVLGKSLVRMVRADLGFSPAHLVVATINLPYVAVAPPQADRIRAFVRELGPRLSERFGRDAAVIATDAPATGNLVNFRIATEQDQVGLEVGVSTVGPGFFRTTGIGLLRGRGFDARDDERRDFVAVIDQSLAHRLFGVDDPVNRKLLLRSIGMEGTIVGVVTKVRQWGVAGVAQPQVYLPLLQLPLAKMTILVRSSEAVASVRTGIQDALHRTDPTIPLSGVRPLTDVIYEPAALPMVQSGAATVLGLLAALMSSVGLYALARSLVLQRTREIGVRLALGAPGSTIVLMVLRGVARLGIFGIAGGILLSWTLRQVLAATLYGVNALDPGAVVLAGVLTTASALLGALVPARAASRLDPLAATRC